MITVILPVHNSEKYLKECIESLIHQTMLDLEFICIDGGSTDSSISILEQYALKDDRFRLLFDRNTSYGHKINLGIEQARGKYIAILETDDLLEPNTYEILYSIAKDFDVDFVSSDYYSFFDLDGTRYRQKTNKLMCDELYDTDIKDAENIKLISKSGIAIWTGLYRRSFLIDNKIKLNETKGAAFQDAGFSFQISIAAKSSYHIKNAFYNYRIDNINSSVKNQNISSIIIDEYKYIGNDLIKREIQDKRIWDEYYIRKYRGYLWNLERLHKDNQKPFYDLLVNDYQEDIHNRNISLDKLPNDLSIPFSKINSLNDMNGYLHDIKKGPIVLFQELMNFMSQRKPLVIFGCGKTADILFQMITDDMKDNIAYFCDNDSSKWRSHNHGLEVINPMEACSIPHASFVIANMVHFDEIKNQLLQSGVGAEDIKIFCEYHSIEKINITD
jgi:glycosyltransferase involved in cell wall biosynthesis